MELFGGFMYLEDKKERLIPILSKYNFSSVIAAVFAVSSWRNNRCAQESCLALNAAITAINTWGEKEIASQEDLGTFFECIYPILQITHLDDPVVPDFGEIKLNYHGKYYSVITGTGHSTPVFAALQYLEGISDALSMDHFTTSILEYCDSVLAFLSVLNAHIDYDFTLDPTFEEPSFEYYNCVKKFFNHREWDNVEESLLFQLSSSDSGIEKVHFCVYEGYYYPLFNPSLVIDYQNVLLDLCSNQELSKVIHNALFNKLKTIYGNGSISNDYYFKNCLLCDEENLLVKRGQSFAIMQNGKLLLFLNCENDDHVEQTISRIVTAFKLKRLSIVNLDNKASSGKYWACRIDNSAALTIICFDEFLNVDETRLSLRGKDEKRVYSAIDLMYMLMISNDLDQIVSFENFDQGHETQVFSFGGSSDYYTLFLAEKGYISKGAMIFGGIYTEADTSASYILSQYLHLQGVFPFSLSSSKFPAPECWEIICDDKGIHHFNRKAKAIPSGPVFIYNNGCTVFLSYDLLSILKETSTTESKLALNTFRAIVERFFKEYYEKISGISSLKGTYVNYICRSLSNQNNDHYIVSSVRSRSHNSMCIDCEVNSYKLTKDIANATNRVVEYNIIRELIDPLVCISDKEWAELLEALVQDSKAEKNVDTALLGLDYYFNPDAFEIKETDVSELFARKEIALVCAKQGVQPGTYTEKDATNVIRTIQETVVERFEQIVKKYNRIELHLQLLSALATEQFSVDVNINSSALCKNIAEAEREQSLENTIGLSEEAKGRKEALIYLLETNLFLANDRGTEKAERKQLSELLSFSRWLVYLQHVSDLCYHTDSETLLKVLDDYRIDAELGAEYDRTHEKEIQRRAISKAYDMRGDESDKEYFERVKKAFLNDTGVHFNIFEAVMHQLAGMHFEKEIVRYEEPVPNVIVVDAEAVIEEGVEFVGDNTTKEEVRKAYELLTIDETKLKTLQGEGTSVLPIWDRENRDNCFAVKPLVKIEDDIIFSPTVVDALRNRWINGFFQFYPPYEIGLNLTCAILWEWKNHYEHLFSSDVEDLLKKSGCEYAKHDIDLRREDRNGNHPTIDKIGDYDVIGLNIKNKTIYIIECKVLQPIGSIFEHSNQQKLFFIKKAYDEKFQKRIDYFRSIAVSFFENIGYCITEDYCICPYMVVNKVFSSYYKPVSFPIVTYGELQAKLETDTRSMD